MGLYVNRIRYKGGSPTLAASSGIINNAVLNGHDFYDDDYNPTPPAHDYSQDYFTVTALESGDFQLRYFGPDIKVVKNGQVVFDWYNPNTANASAWTTIISLNAGDYVLMRKTANTIGNNGGNVQCTGNFEVSGNIMSLLYSDDFVGKTSFPTTNSNCFSRLFNGVTKLVNAENLVLPTTTLTESCYYYMFRDCTSLTAAPELPATTLAKNCYYNMFQGCTSLTTAPSILPATTLTESCYYYMFQGCTSLTAAPELPATTLAQNCYQSMFQDCTSLVTAPELLATTLTQYCYQGMFSGCTSLVTAPELLATTLANYCCSNMFRSCTSLTTAPKLLATKLKDYCYQAIFYGCSALNKVTCLATNISAYRCLQNWVNGVSATGTFIKNPSMSSWPSGTSGIPNNWTVQDYVE